MIFLLIFLIILLSILTIKIKIEIINLKFISKNQNKLNKNYKIKITIYTFFKIPVLLLKITNEKIQKIINNENFIKTIKKQELKLIKNKNDIDVEVIQGLKSVKLEIEEMDLKIDIGTENAATTAFLVPIISTILAMILSKKIKKYNNKQIFSITPIYINQNLINVEFSGIFEIKMIHIINTICILNKKRKGDKYERTSNRRSYDYGYE